MSNLTGDDISFLVLGILSFIFALSNSIPAFLRVYKTKNSSSLSLYTQVLRVVVSIIVITTMIGKTWKYWEHGSGGISPLIWRICSLFDLVTNVFGFLCATYVLIHRFITFKAGDESFKKYFKLGWKYIVIYCVFALLVIADVIIVVWYKVHTKISIPWIYWMGFVSGILGIFTMVPLTIRVIVTKDTYSISFIAEASLMIAMIFWTAYDTIGLHNNVKENMPYFISDIYTSVWVVVIFSYKLREVIKNRK